MAMDNALVEVTTASSSLLEVPIKAPWTASIKIFLTLRNSLSAVMISTNQLNSTVWGVSQMKWTLYDPETSSEVRDPHFSPSVTSSGQYGDAYTGKKLLQPNKPLELTYHPFDSRLSEKPSLLESKHTYQPRFRAARVSVHATDAQSFLDLVRLRREGRLLYSPDSTALQVKFPGVLSIRPSPTCTPWIEVRIIPSHKEFKLGSKIDFSICLRITLRDCSESILIDSNPESAIFNQSSMLKQAGGLLHFINIKTCIPIQRPQMNIHQSKVQAIVYRLKELTPNSSIDVHHTLFNSETGVEEIEMEGFSLGGEYDVELDQCCGIARWSRGRKLKTMLWKVISGDWKGEPEWEFGWIPLVQRDLLGTFVFKIV